MKSLSVLLLGLVALASQSQAQTRYELFHESNRPYDIEPAIEVVVALTPEQKAKLETAMEARKNDAASLEAEQELKAQPSKETPEYAAAKEKRDKARSAAKTAYLEVVNATLTPEQSDLIKKLQRFSTTIQKEAETSLLEKTPGEKPAWKDLMARCAEIGRPRLSEVLTPEQIALLSSASAAPKE
jgi:hypothetical protein